MTSIRSAAIALCLLAGIPLAPCLAAQQSERQAQREEAKFEEMLGKMSTWSQFYAAYNHKPNYDDGGPAEEYSAFVVITLTKHWDSVKQLQEYTRRNPAFEKFVTSHIDATASEDQLRMLVKYSMTRAPHGAAPLCADIAAAARHALADLKQTLKP